MRRILSKRGPEMLSISTAWGERYGSWRLGDLWAYIVTEEVSGCSDLLTLKRPSKTFTSAEEIWKPWCSLALESILSPSNLARIRVMDFHDGKTSFEKKLMNQKSGGLYHFVSNSYLFDSLEFSAELFRKLYLMTVSPISWKQLFLIPLMNSFVIHLLISKWHVYLLLLG